MTMPRAALRGRFLLLMLFPVLVLAGCQGGEGQGEGPGHRYQPLALSPQKEYQLGDEAYAEVLRKYRGRTLPRDAPEVRAVRNVGSKIANVAENNRPLQREINLHLENYRFDWQFNVLQDDQINAFCLPGGRVAVYTGLFKVIENDDHLATVLGHEIAHALAHHTSERLARAGNSPGGFENILGKLSELKHDREQESEADHIGVFLMTFAGYDPRQAVVFWERMERATARGGRPPEILSDHPSDAQRIAQLQQWARDAIAGKKAYDAGRIAR